MKIKEVCAQTGLTERAVRFYVQEKLVAPQAQRRGGRTWLDFSPADVDRLRAIATLRKAGFTLEEIRSMGADFRGNAPNAAFALRRRLQEALDAYDKLRFTDTAQASGLEDYAALLEREVSARELPAADQRGPLSRLNWASSWESLCMVLAVILAWRLYAWLVDALSRVSDLFFFVFMNVLVVLIPFLVVFLPVALVLGSKAGKWLYRHLEYVP